MKKLLVLLALCMVLSVVLVACQETTTPSDDTTDVTTETPTEQPSETESETESAPETETQAPDTTDTQAPDTTDTDPPTTDTEPPVVVDPVYTHVSFDECDPWIGETQGTAFFTPGASKDWDKIANVDDYTVEYIRVWGWVAFYADTVGEFGYQIDDQEPVYDASFAWETEQPVIDAAAGSGGKSASRMKILIPVRNLDGEHTIKALVKDIHGTVDTIVEFTLNKAVDPASPVFLLDAATINTTATGAPDIASAVLSEDGSYTTLTNGTVGDPWFTFRNINANAQFVAVKYRTSVPGKAFNYFVASTGNDATGAGDMAAPQSYVSDGMWHVAIVDISTVDAVNEENFISFLRYDMYTDGQNQAIDVAWIGAFNTAEYAQAYFDKSMLVADNTNTYASDVTVNETATALGNTDLANFFTLNLPLPGSQIEEIDGNKVYHMTSINEMLADVNGAYYLKANVVSANNAATFFVRGYQVVNSDAIIAAFDPNAGLYKINNYYETDSANAYGGAGIYANIVNGNLFIMVKYYNADTTTRVGNAVFQVPCEGSELMMADNGYTVSIIVSGVTYATIDLMGAQSYADINEVLPEGQFAAKAVVTLKNGTTQTIENTLVAATVNSQVGLASRAGSAKFTSIEVGGFSAIDVPAMDIVEPDPVDPNAPIAVGTPEYLAECTKTGNQSSAVVSADGTYVTITAGDGNPIDPNFWVLPPNSMISGVQYIGLKYRTTVNPGGEFFVGSTGITGGADEIKFDYIADGEWHVLIIDLTAHAPVNAEGLVNYLRYDFFMSPSVGSTIDVENIVLFASLESANAFYGLEDPSVDEPVVEDYNVPQENWTVSGHKPMITPADDPSHGPMVAAGGIATGALLHQGSVGVGEIDLSKYSKVVIYIGIDNSDVTLNAHAANAANRVMLTNADVNMVMSPAADQVVASVDYTPCGWAITAIEIDLTGVDYNGPVYVTYDTLPGTFMLIGAIEFIA